MDRKHHRIGKITLVTGPMFSGKTTYLIDHIQEAVKREQYVQVFMPAFDIRYSHYYIQSHDKVQMPSTPVTFAYDILGFIKKNTSLIGIDEGQFFDQSLIDVCKKLSLDSINVLVCGLDRDYLGRPFGFIPDIAAISNNIIKLTAICNICGSPAQFSQRICNGEPVTDEGRLLALGGTDLYQARCISHFVSGDNQSILRIFRSLFSHNHETHRSN